MSYQAVCWWITDTSVGRYVADWNGSCTAVHDEGRCLGRREADARGFCNTIVDHSFIGCWNPSACWWCNRTWCWCNSMNLDLWCKWTRRQYTKSRSVSLIQQDSWSYNTFLMARSQREGRTEKGEYEEEKKLLWLLQKIPRWRGGGATEDRTPPGLYAYGHRYVTT